MKHSPFVVADSAVLLFSTFACQAADIPAATTKESSVGRDGQGTHRRMDHEGMPHRCMHKGMGGEGHGPHMVALPSLPPGNAKLELAMQAEIMQKVGEILAKYAAQVKETPAAP